FAVAAILISGVGCSKEKTTVKGEGDKELTLITPKAVNVPQGGTKTFTVEVERKKFDDPIDLDFTDLPKGVTLEEKTWRVEKDKNNATFTLKAEEKAALEDGHTAKVTASGGGMKAGPKEIKINVTKK